MRDAIQLILTLRPEVYDSPPVPHVPAGYLLRCYTDADEKAYMALTHKAGLDWPLERLRWIRRLVVPGGLFVIEHSATGGLVATALCKHNPIEGHPRGGELGWVAGDPDHAGRGLGLAVCAAATAHFIRAGYRDIYVRTQHWRLAAIKTYLKLGYEPVVTGEATADLWRDILTTLNWREPDAWPGAEE